MALPEADACLADVSGGVAITVRVIPRARRTGIDGMRGSALLVRLNVPPVDGAANDALVAFLAGIFGRRTSDITLVSGRTSRDKRLVIAGMTAAEASAILRTCSPPI
jgi:uncharacterized protein (TIGR00251 family)